MLLAAGTRGRPGMVMISPQMTTMNPAPADSRGRLMASCGSSPNSNMLVKDGKAVMPFGVMGGQYQAFGHMYFLTNMFEFGLDPQEAINLPRLFPTLTGSVDVESGMPEASVKGLQALGHQTQAPSKPIGGAQAIRIDWDEGTLTGASEPRKDGSALGY